ncbi:hypothetical protein, partial [Clavibacter michiganensis]|uniref:hypothetical protein n=1 Tax=Clavibacter michiganensis TaxID=28447 RepID=UPI00292CFC41
LGLINVMNVNHTNGQIFFFFFFFSRQKRPSETWRCLGGWEILKRDGTPPAPAATGMPARAHAGMPVAAEAGELLHVILPRTEVGGSFTPLTLPTQWRGVVVGGGGGVITKKKLVLWRHGLE